MPGRSWYLAEAIISTPAGTPIASPQTRTVLAGDNYVDWVRWRFPPGPSGTLGISFWQGQGQIIPWAGNGTFIVGDNEEETAQVGFECPGGINLVSYNTGTFPHEIIISVQYQPVSVTLANTPPQPQIIQLVADELLSQPSPVETDITALLEVAN